MPARYATPRDPRRVTDGPVVAAVAAALGTPFMPWQRQVCDVAGERLPDGSYAYPIVVVTVPRQSGKTTLIRARGVARCLSRRDAQVFYTAQTGKDARERWEDLCKQIARSPLRSRTRALRTAGAVRLAFANASAFRVFAPVASSLHGYTPLEVYLDEAWAFDARQGDSLMGAIVPAQITVRDRQLWIVSTRGTAESTFLHSWLQAGREGEPGVALFDWSCPEGADPYDPAVVERFHPAVGYTMTARDIIAAGSTSSRAEYERAYANRATRAAESLVPADRWADLAVTLTPPPVGAVALGLDVAYDRSTADLVAAWDRGDGTVATKIVRADAGEAWLAAAAREWAERLDAAAVVVADSGPVRTLIPDLDGIPGLRVLSASGYASACGEWLAEVHHDGIRHDGAERLAASGAGAVTRVSGDLWQISRRQSKGSTAAVVGSVLATYGVRHPVPIGGAPFIITGQA